MKNQIMKNYKFLECMYRDEYFPTFLVDKGKKILEDVCYAIEKNNIDDLAPLYKVTHNATELFNNLNEEFYEHESEIESMARDCIGENFKEIAIAYGFLDADIEELISPRDW